MIDIDEILIGLKEIPTATIANALDDVGKFINSSASIRPVNSSMRMIGRAVTVEVEVGEAGDFTSEDFRVGAMIDAAQSGDVLVVAANGAHASIWGGWLLWLQRSRVLPGLSWMDLFVMSMKSMLVDLMFSVGM